MQGKVSQIWTNVIEIHFEKTTQKPKLEQIVTLHEGKTIFAIKTIISKEKVRAVLIQESRTVAIGDKVVNTLKKLMVPIGQEAKGHVYDILGNPLIANKKNRAKFIEIDSTISKNKTIDFKHEILETGIKAIDFFIPILKGHKLGIFGGAGVGKTVVMKEIIFNVSKSNSNSSSIFIGSGERSREGLELYNELKESKLLDKTTLYIAQMNEPPGSRMHIVPYGITQAEYLRDKEKEDVLLFVDNIFRFIQAGNEVSSSLGKKPSTGGYQSTLESDVANVEERLYATSDGSITSFQTVFLPMDDLADPAAVAIFGQLDGSLVLTREKVSKNIFPAFDPLASSSNSVNSEIIGQEHFDAIIETKKILQKYNELEDVIMILGIEEMDLESKIIIKKALQLQNFFTQNFSMAESFTKEKGAYVSLEDTVKSVIKIINNEYINQSPSIFSFVGSNSDIPTDAELEELEKSSKLNAGDE